jgi:hypothetical protein
VLTEEEAVALLTLVVGTRVAVDPVAASAVAGLCGYLPLALRLAAARLVSCPQWTLADLVDRLPGTEAPLAELAVPGRTVETASALSHRQLPEPARLVFRRLGLHPAGDFGEHAAAALAGLPVTEIRPTLGRVRRHQPAGGPEGRPVPVARSRPRLRRRTGRARARAAMGDRPELARAHDGLGDALAHTDSGATRGHWSAALDLYVRMGVPERHAIAERLAGAAANLGAR